MTSPIRVLVIDDSVVARRAIAVALQAHPDMELVGFAPDGRSALARIAELQPDVVTLDVNMPEMDGFATLAVVRRQHPRLPIVMFSVLTARGARVTVDALLAGANDYAIKPSASSGGPPPIERIRDELVPKVRALALRARAAPVEPTFAPPSTRGGRPLPSRPVGLVAIGASTGGPGALAAVLGGLSADFGVPIVIVQHMPPVFTRRLAERLCTLTELDVHEAVQGEPLTAGSAVFAPGDFHIEVAMGADGGRVQLTQTAPENFCRPAIDVLFRSAAATYGAATLGVVMTGMGTDGLRGAKAIRDAGGNVVVQDEASSTVWAMPGAVVAAGLASSIVPLTRMATELTTRVPRRQPSRSPGEPRP